MSAARIAKTAIKIPMRIERGPTDILKALASTVRHIPGEPDAVLQDDPFLLPVKPADRTIYTLSKLTGRSTAKFLLNKHPELFFRDDAEPKIDAFLPPEEFRADMEFTEDDIKWCIEHNDPVNGLIAYKSLQDKNVKLTNETLLNFFELICYTNEEKVLDPLDYQKIYFARDNERQLVQQTWKINGVASKIFNQIKEDLDPPRVYSTMIAGLSKFNEHATAKQVFEDFSTNHPDKGLYAIAYDGLISSVPNLNSSVATAHQAVDEIVGHMEQHLVMPNLRVFNSILDCYKRFNCDEVTCQKALKLVNDMRALEIEPSLFTYESLITILCKYKSGRVYRKLVNDLLDYMVPDDKLLSIKDDRDTMFLRNCMRLFANYLNSLQLANKLHKIYMKRPNLFASQNYRQMYLDNYFRLIITTERLENIINFYEMHVPMNYRPTADTYDALAEVLDLYQADESVVKRIGNDIITFGLGGRVKNDTIFRKYSDYVEALEQAMTK